MYSIYRTDTQTNQRMLVACFSLLNEAYNYCRQRTPQCTTTRPIYAIYTPNNRKVYDTQNDLAPVYADYLTIG